MHENWLSTREAAARMSVSIPTVREYLKRGLIHGVKVGSKWEIDPESVRKFTFDYKGERV